ncbi:MAG: hypothetical protein L6R39_007339 [Caloplaca ligustica]|nr:MAG: hypothetical protein L6R39_007339 [Caloplaca ligustica]
MTLDNEPLLPLTLQEKDAGPMADLKPQKYKRFTSSTRNISIHTGLILLYTVVSLVTIRAFTSTPGSHILRHRPQHGQVSASIVPGNDKLERKLYDTLDRNPFAGPPDPSIDMAWHGLLENIHVRVTKEELERSQQTSISLPEGGGYLSWLGVYHELHCLVGHTSQRFY